MQNGVKFLLDSGDPNEYKEIEPLAEKQGSKLWGSTTNPTLIAKKLAGKKVSQQEAFDLQKKLVMDILRLVPGAVSAEVFCEETTTGKEMAEQGRDISTWDKRVVVKLPTTKEGFIARTILRKEKIPVNNTLVFSQAQIYAICLHEQLAGQTYGPINDLFPPFISPFVGRLDDIGEDGMNLVENGMRIKKTFPINIWMLEASVRTVEHLKRGLRAKTELLTAPNPVYKAWFELSKQEQDELDILSYAKKLKPIPYWSASNEVKNIKSIEDFDDAISSGILDISHPLTEKGLLRFADDWKAILI